MQCFCMFGRTRSDYDSCPESDLLSDSCDSELFKESLSFTVSESEVRSTLHHYVIVLTLLPFNFHQ